MSTVKRKPGRPKGSKSKMKVYKSGSKKAYYGVSFRKPSTRKQASKRKSVMTGHVYHYGEVPVTKKYLKRNLPKKRKRVSKK